MKQNNFNFEAGRSMVEMLGVLAIIGVLSIGGIAGYTYTMDKRKANDVLNEVNKRYVVGSSQVVLGRPLNLSEFPTTVDGYTIGAMDASAVNVTEFGIEVSDVPEGVCNRLLDMTDNWKDLLEYAPTTCGETNTMQFVFEGDMGAEVPYDDNAGAKECETAADCVSGCQQCSDGKCISICGLGEYCGKGASDSEYTCVGVASTTCTSNDDCTVTGCCSSDGVCVVPDCGTGFWVSWENVCYDNDVNEFSGTCLADSHSCTSNVDCGTDEYCAIHGSECYEITTGTCLPLGTVTTVDLDEDAKGSEYNGYTYSDTRMSWWSADNWCKAQGMRLASLSDLGCTTDDCSDWDALRAAFGSAKNTWVSDSRGSCDAWFVFLNDGNVFGVSRHGFRSPVCR